MIALEFKDYPDTSTPLSAEKLNEMQEKIFNMIYPVGSIYLSVNNVNPSFLFGGTWEEFAKGRTLVGVDTSQTEFNSVEKTGGAKTHTLTVNEMPSHKHRNINHMVTTNAPGYGAWVRDVNVGTGEIAGYIASADTSEVGDNQPHNNLQPYITVYMWKRVA
jgi:hypothetical protein